MLYGNGGGLVVATDDVVVVVVVSATRGVEFLVTLLFVFCRSSFRGPGVLLNIRFKMLRIAVIGPLLPFVVGDDTRSVVSGCELSAVPATLTSSETETALKVAAGKGGEDSNGNVCLLLSERELVCPMK